MFGICECRPVLPAYDMDESLNFYRDLGFHRKMLEPSTATLSRGSMSFLLKLSPLADNNSPPLLIVTITSLREWWVKVKLLDLGSHHRVKPPREPRREPWGQMIGYLYDPSGVNWHFVERAKAPDMPHKRDRERPLAHLRPSFDSSLYI